MLKITKHTIGFTEHLALRGAYRTFCGKGTELANRRKPVLPPCEACIYGARVAELEAEGMTTSDAQGIADSETWPDPMPMETALHEFSSDAS